MSLVASNGLLGDVRATFRVGPARHLGCDRRMLRSQLERLHMEVTFVLEG